MRYNEQENIMIFDRCLAFISEIGIPVSFRDIGDDSFLPGFLIENGTIVIERGMLQHPGDILHEAGHIAVVPAADRLRLTEEAIIKRRNREAEEVMAIAWSYAACMHLGIDPAYVFHTDGYRGGSDMIIDSCRSNEYMGIFMLESLGMTRMKGTASGYPHMTKWLRG